MSEDEKVQISLLFGHISYVWETIENKLFSYSEKMNEFPIYKIFLFFVVSLYHAYLSLNSFVIFPVSLVFTVVVTIWPCMTSYLSFHPIWSSIFARLLAFLMIEFLSVLSVPPQYEFIMHRMEEYIVLTWGYLFVLLWHLHGREREEWH